MPGPFYFNFFVLFCFYPLTGVSWAGWTRNWSDSFHLAATFNLKKLMHPSTECSFYYFKLCDILYDDPQ